jgi:hypothetical protein
MNTLKILSLIGKIAEVAITAVAPFGDSRIGLYIFVGASILKDAINRMGI